jgi:ubiquinone/menaquinone biosynthesis C-methylase UbiE
VANADRFAELQAARAEALSARIFGLLPLRDVDRALDVGTGTGAFAFALAPHVREVVALDRDPAMIERARADAPPNVELVVGDAEDLPFGPLEFDLVGTMRTLHHSRRPEVIVAEMSRVARPGATILVVDQLAPVDPLAALELNRFERARDPSTTRLLADGDMRGLFDANGLVLRHADIEQEDRDLDDYLDLAGCAGGERERAHSMAPKSYRAQLGWYVLTRA